MQKRYAFFSTLLLLSLFAACKPKAPVEAPVAAVPDAPEYADVKQTLGFVPNFVTVLPKEAVVGAWEDFKALEMGQTLIPNQYKELIGLAVSAQIPCHYCSYAHLQFSTLQGASSQAQQEAVALAAQVRRWSTVLNGAAVDMDTFKKGVDAAFAFMAGTADAKAAALKAMPAGLNPTQIDMWSTFGGIPPFMNLYPSAGLKGVWEEMKGLDLNPNTAIPPKYKALVSLGVAAQVPCQYCVYFHRSEAKANGATEQEMEEAVAMSALTRHWSTIINGNGVDYASWVKDVDTMVANAQKNTAK